MVVVEATDDRNVKRKGLIGVDLDVSWNSSINLWPTAPRSVQIANVQQLETKGTAYVIAGAEYWQWNGSPVGSTWRGSGEFR